MNCQCPFTHLPFTFTFLGKITELPAQRAMFTVQGLDTRALDEQLGENSEALRYVDLEPVAAVYGVKHLMDFLGLNAYAISLRCAC